MRAAEAFRHVLPGHLDMHAAGLGALGRVDVEEARAPRARIASKRRVL